MSVVLEITAVLLATFGALYLSAQQVQAGGAVIASLNHNETFMDGGHA